MNLLQFITEEQWETIKVLGDKAEAAYLARLDNLVKIEPHRLFDLQSMFAKDDKECARARGEFRTAVIAILRDAMSCMEEAYKAQVAELEHTWGELNAGRRWLEGAGAKTYYPTDFVRGMYIPNVVNTPDCREPLLNGKCPHTFIFPIKDFLTEVQRDIFEGKYVDQRLPPVEPPPPPPDPNPRRGVIGANEIVPGPLGGGT